MAIKSSSLLLLLSALIVSLSTATSPLLNTTTSTNGDEALTLQTRPITGAVQHYRKSGENCFLGKQMTCRTTKEKICIFSLQPVTCTFDATETIVMDKVLPVVNKIFSAVSGGKLDFVINFAEKEIKEVFENFKMCLGALDGSEPNCKSMDRMKSCAGAASTLLGTAPVMRAIGRLAGKSAQAVTSAANNLGLLKVTAEDQCKTGCKKGDCANEPLVYAPPTNCQCTRMFLVSNTANFGGYTPGVCAMNMQVFQGVRTESDYARVAYVSPWKKEPFPSVGCFVDLKQKACKAAFQTVFTSELNFVPCTNQLGQTHAISNVEHQIGGLTPALKTAPKSTVHVHVRVRTSEP